MNTEEYDDGYGPRIALFYPYDPSTNNLLKDVLGYPQFMWDKDRKRWSIQKSESTIREAVELLGTCGYDFSHLLRDIVKGNTSAEHRQCSVATKGNRLILRWPWINDPNLRDDVRLAVKSITGRKFHKEQKCWSIPLGHGHNLYKLLENIYTPLADALIGNESVSDYLEGSIERVAISQATELTEEKLDELRNRLQGKFPDGLELYPFQYVGVAFAEMADGRCLIGDAMGIGKTIQALTYAALHPENGPYVVVCPANVKYNWRNEITKWLPDRSIHIVNKGKDDIPSADFILINFDLMNKQKERLLDLLPKGIIIDESHYLKNSSAQRTKATLEVASICSAVICLSGTAISARPSEFFTTLNLLKPSQFPSWWEFGQQYCDPWHNGYGWDFSGASNTKMLNERIRDFAIRRLKSEVLPDLPDKTRTFMPVDLSVVQRSNYDQSLLDWESQYEDYVNFGGMPPGFVLNMFTDLRHECGLMKVKPAATWIEEYNQSTGKPLVVFCHHKDVASQLSKTLEDVGLHTSHIGGSISAEERTRIVTAFQAGHIPVLICNTVAAKEGITLTAADTVLFLEREWTPAWEEQAEDRVHRIGQESGSVHAIYFSCIGTIDEHFDRVVESKRTVVKAVLDGAETEEGRSTLVKELLNRMKQERKWK